MPTNGLSSQRRWQNGKEGRESFVRAAKIVVLFNRRLIFVVMLSDIASLWRVRELQSPKWYQILSCQQVAYIEFLATAIRLDSDENVTDRTSFVLTGIGLFPRPTKQMLKKCLRCGFFVSKLFFELIRGIFCPESILTIPLAKSLYFFNNRKNLINNKCL